MTAPIAVPDRPLPAGVALAPARPLGDAPYLAFDVFADWGIRAIATTRQAGSFGTGGTEPVGAVMDRWAALHGWCAPDPERLRFATARQVHEATVLEHGTGWRGWLRGPAADGHLALARGLACAVTVADCVPVYVAHPSGAIAMLHSGWRSTEAGILAVAVRGFAAAGLSAGDLRVLLGPSICGGCYEVSPEVYARLTGRSVDRPTAVSLHAVIAEQARSLGVRDLHATALCTRCDRDRLFSHRAGDAGRLLGVLVADD